MDRPRSAAIAGTRPDHGRLALRAGVVDRPELENGTWRYRVRGGRISVVVAFRSEDTLVVITAWRTG